MTWRVARSLERLREQVNAVAPERSIRDDGTIGDERHQANTSDHNPWVKDGGIGVVTAMDLTHDPHGGFDSYLFADVLRLDRDVRIKYVISNSRIWNPSISQDWRPYHGSNPHDHHVHISVKSDKAHYDSIDPWNIGAPKADPSSPVVDDKPVLRKGAAGGDVKYLQTLLGLLSDGQFGPATEKAVEGFQKAHGLVVDGIVGSYTWSALLGGRGAPEPAPTAPQVAGRKFTNIVATVFGGVVDAGRERSAYDNHRIGDTEQAVALPARFKGARSKIRVTSRLTGKSAIASIEDVGPWYTDDPYWEGTGRPLAERPGPVIRGPNKGKIPNKAGIDLSPALAKAIGIRGGMGSVDWEFV